MEVETSVKSTTANQRKADSIMTDVSLTSSNNKVLQPLNSNEKMTQATADNTNSKINKPSTNIKSNITLTCNNQQNYINVIKPKNQVAADTSSPNKSYHVPISAKPTAPNSANRPLPAIAPNLKPKQLQPTQNQKQQQQQEQQRNFISGAQLQQQQQQYIMYQQNQQQIINMQRNFQSLQQQRANANETNSDGTKSLAQNTITAEFKKQQTIPENYNQSNNISQQQQHNQQKMTQQLSQFLNSQLKIEQTEKPIQPKKVPLAPKPANTSISLAGGSTNVPTIFTATTDANGQLIFKTVEPSSATAAALAAFHKHQQMQQHQKQQSSINFYNNNNNMVPSVIEGTSKTMQADTDSSGKANFATSMQEMLRQRLLQEELKFQKLQKKLDLLTGKIGPNENLKSDTEKPIPYLGTEMELKKLWLMN